MGDDLIAELDIRLMMVKAGNADKISFTPAEVCEIRASLGGYRAALASRPAVAEGRRDTSGDTDDLNERALHICRREVREFDERGASLQTDIHAAVKVALASRPAVAEGEPVAWRVRHITTEGKAHGDWYFRGTPMAPIEPNGPYLGIEVQPLYALLSAAPKP